MRFYVIENIQQSWGDYGDILWSGMTNHLPRQNGQLQLERTGPFVPSAFLSGLSDLIVNNYVKENLEKTGLKGFKFMEVLKTKIVCLEWEKWDKSLETPPVIPESGEPEDYILDNQHNQEIANKIGKLWEVCELTPAIVRIKKKYIFFGQSYQLLEKDSWNGQEIFSSKFLGYKFVTENAKKIFEQYAPNCLYFKEIEVV